MLRTGSIICFVGHKDLAACIKIAMNWKIKINHVFCNYLPHALGILLDICDCLEPRHIKLKVKLKRKINLKAQIPTIMDIATVTFLLME